MIIPGSILYITSLWAIKVALVLFYKKLAAPGTRLQLIYSITLGFLGVSWAVVFFDNIFQCWPESRKWAENPSGKIASAPEFIIDPNYEKNNVARKPQMLTTGSQSFVSRRFPRRKTIG